MLLVQLRLHIEKQRLLVGLGVGFVNIVLQVFRCKDTNYLVITFSISDTVINKVAPDSCNTMSCIIEVFNPLLNLSSDENSFAKRIPSAIVHRWDAQILKAMRKYRHYWFRPIKRAQIIILLVHLIRKCFWM